MKRAFLENQRYQHAISPGERLAEAVRNSARLNIQTEFVIGIDDIDLCPAHFPYGKQQNLVPWRLTQIPMHCFFGVTLVDA